MDHALAVFLFYSGGHRRQIDEMVELSARRNSTPFVSFLQQLTEIS